jgi:hypothetical protein
MSKPSAWRWFGWLMLLGILGVALAAAISIGMVINDLPPDLLVTVDGEQINLHGLSAGHAWLAFGGVVLAIVIVVIVVPLALLFGLGVPLLIAGLALVAALLVAGVAVAVVSSPLILLALLFWWAVRPKRASAPAAPPAPAGPPRVPMIGQHTDNSTPLA